MAARAFGEVVLGGGASPRLSAEIDSVPIGRVLNQCTEHGTGVEFVRHGEGLDANAHLLWAAENQAFHQRHSGELFGAGDDWIRIHEWLSDRR